MPKNLPQRHQAQPRGQVASTTAAHVRAFTMAGRQTVDKHNNKLLMAPRPALSGPTVGPTIDPTEQRTLLHSTSMPFG